jgi:hypothetical protein
MMKVALLFCFIAVTASPALAQDGMSCAAHHAAVDKRGDAVMGFDHDKTTHHFKLTSDGGVIAVSANDESDTASRDAIRSHLTHIAKMFADGNFEAPMLIHDQAPPGVPVMQAGKKAISYVYEDTPSGAEIKISTKDVKAVAAIHDFLRFQISEHQTGDSGEVLVPTEKGK